MFERFTRGARAAVTAAVAEAEQRGDRHVGTEHLLLGLARGDAPTVAATLAQFGIDPAAARAALVDVDAAALAAVGIDLDPDVVRGVGGRAPYPGTPARWAAWRNHRPFTDGAKAVLNGALEEAKPLGHRRLGAEHILLALTTRSAPDPAARVLERLGAEPSALRPVLLTHLRRKAA